MIEPSCVVQLWSSTYFCYIQGLNHREVRGGHHPTHMQVIVKPVRSCTHTKVKDIQQLPLNAGKNNCWRLEVGGPRVD